jgi:hypothetical protein
VLHLVTPLNGVLLADEHSIDLEAYQDALFRDGDVAAQTLNADSSSQ